MASSMVKLISLLTENERVLGELACALADEQRCIVDLDLEQLAENGGRKGEIMDRLTRVRDEGQALLRQAGAEQGINEIPSLTVLIAAAAAAEQSQLRPLQQRLLRLGQRLERQHATNRRMLENSIGMIKSSMALFIRLLGGCDTYGAQGRITSGGTSGSIFRQEI